MTRTLAALFAAAALHGAMHVAAASQPAATPAAATPGTAPAAGAASARGASAAAGLGHFSPQGSIRAVRQASARFVTPMVALGDPRLPDPFTIDCAAPGRGRWVDGRNWVYDFEAELPAGLRCTFRVKDGLTDLAGRAVRAPHPFVFDTGGPAILASLPHEGHEYVDENQAFLLRLDAIATPESIAAHARCVVEGLAETLRVRVLAGEERRALLAQRRQLGHAYLRLLRGEATDAMPDTSGRAIEQAETLLLAIACQRPLPAGAAMQLVWGRGITAASGIATQSDQRLGFRVRPEFTARVECQRVNAHAGCLPFRPIEVRFSAPVPRARALAVKLVAGSISYAARAGDAAQAPMLESIRFEGLFPPLSTVFVMLPGGLVDDAGRPLANAARFPLRVRIDDYPPLAKFAASFGILEAREGGVLPVTLRSLDEPAAGQPATIAARRLRVGADPAAIGAWLRRVEAAGQPRGDWITDGATGERVWKDATGAESVFTPADSTSAFSVDKPGGAREFEVVGIPLTVPGLHVVELESRRLGQSLLGADQPRYVATAALVTNLAVHFKWGRESSLVWVTRLDDGQPVAGATVTINDYCDGRERWSGRTDRDGIARIPTSFGEPVNGDYCGDERRRPLLATATLGEDFSFALGSWTQGIAPWDFGLQTGSDRDTELQHTVFDRVLFRPGETVAMKHFLRAHRGEGFAIGAGLPGERKVVVAHQGSDQTYELRADFDANGTATQQWTLPPGARNGDYEVRIEDARGRPRPSGRFKVEDFRLPTLRAAVTGPAEPLVRPQAVTLDLHVAWLAGGGAADLPVTLRTYVEERPVRFAAYEDWKFGGEVVREGLSTPGTEAAEAGGDDGDGAAIARGLPKTQVLPLTLDANGARRVTVDRLPALEHAALLTAELEYPDANGERLTATGRVRLNPAALHVGIRREGWVGAVDRLRFKVVVLDLDGRPVPKQALRVALYRVTDYSYRKRLLGGFYAYETTRETVKLAASCAGRSDAHGLLACEVAPDASGQIWLRAETRDRDGHLAGATTSVWVAGEDEWWFGGTAGDRMDVLSEKPEYEAGETARLQVRMPFRKALALVTLEREGVLSGFVKRLSGRSPVVELPLAGHHAPNVFVSVLAVRGRVPRADGRGTPRPPDGEVTALVDLNKPAFRLGIAKLRVGWRSHRLDVQVRPERIVYRTGERAQVQLRVLRSDGGVLPAGGEIALAAVDEALLELAPNDSWRLLDAMMAPRGLEVSTATAQMQVIGKRHYGRKAVPHGGGGGRDRARSSFDSLLSWQARVPLDAEGRAVVTVPLNDSLTAFRIVAVAHAGAQHFGTGSATMTSTQDLILMSGLPPLVREGDRFLATFTLRNTTERSVRATLTAAVTPAPAEALAAREIELAPGAARDVAWTFVVPPGTAKLDWDLRLRLPDGTSGDRLKVSQQVVAAVPVKTYQATLVPLDAPLALSVARPAGALPGRGGIEVSLRAKLADGQDGVRDYMSAYPYTCIEQSLSRAVALRDPGLWDSWMARLPAYLDGDGLLRFFASDALPGEDSLTAHVLTIADEAGYAVPDALRQRMIAGLTGFVQGRIVRDSALPTADLSVRRLAAIAALARHGAAEPAMLDSLVIEPALWPTSAVLDWIGILKRLPAVKQAAERRTAAFGILRARLDFQGTTLGLSTERRDALWWLMVSTDSNAARLVLAVLDRAEWKADVPRLVRGLLARQRRGHWDTTVANAWATLALERFSAAFEATPVAGRTSVVLGEARYDMQWPAARNEGGIGLLWPTAPDTLRVTHTGSGRPWAVVQAKAALPLTAPLAAGFSVTRTLMPVEQRTPGRWTRGDVVRVRLELEARSDMSWVVVDDPVPAGSSILGAGLGGQSERLTRHETRDGAVWPAFEERRFDAFRAYYRFVPKGLWTVEYTLRLNNPGTFQLPATRVEAMYAPEMLAERPNAAFTVEAD